MLPHESVLHRTTLHWVTGAAPLLLFPILLVLAVPFWRLDPVRVAAAVGVLVILVMLVCRLSSGSESRR
jgi:hypothetical protein